MSEKRCCQCQKPIERWKQYCTSCFTQAMRDLEFEAEQALQGFSLNLVDLRGVSEKQISWAASLRLRAFADLAKRLGGLGDRDIANGIVNAMNQIPSSKFWIDNKNARPMGLLWDELQAEGLAPAA